MKHKAESTAVRPICLLLLIGYLGFLFWRMFVHAFGSYQRVQTVAADYNLVPFRTIMSFIRYASNYSMEVVLYNLLGNIIVFIPLGFLLPLCYKSYLGFMRTVTIAFTIIFTAEILQFLLRVGVFDVDDILLNMIGVMIGYAVIKMVKNYGSAEN